MKKLELKIEAFNERGDLLDNLDLSTWRAAQNADHTRRELLLELEIGEVVQKDIVVEGIDLSLSRAERLAFQDLLDDTL